MYKGQLDGFANSVRNGQRQTDIPKLVSPFTKERIDEYHEAENLKPVIIDGEIRKYNKALYKQISRRI